MMKPTKAEVLKLRSPLHNLTYGVAQARRGWIEAKDLLNTLSLAKLQVIFTRRHGARSS
jgi:hypothetical protein